MIMKKYLVFNGYVYYPRGGWSDFKESFRTLEEAQDYVKQWPGDWWQIVDADTGELVAEEIS